MRKFTDSDIATIRLMTSCGYPATTIAKKLGRVPLSVRAKCVAMGLPLRRRGKPRFGSRFQIPIALWDNIELAALARGMKATKLCHMVLAAIVHDDLWDAVIDGPSAVRSSPRQRRQNVRLAFAPQLVGRIDTPRFDVVAGTAR